MTNIKVTALRELAEAARQTVPRLGAEEDFAGACTPQAIITLLDVIEAAQSEMEIFKRDALAVDAPEQMHVAGKWCADLHCAKCYSADFRFRHAAPPDTEALRKELEEVKAQRDAMALNDRRHRHLMQSLYPQLAVMVGVTFGSCTPAHDIIRRIGLCIDADIAAKGGKV